MCLEDLQVSLNSIVRRNQNQTPSHRCKRLFRELIFCGVRCSAFGNLGFSHFTQSVWRLLALTLSRFAVYIGSSAGSRKIAIGE